ncbi:sulfotransferase [Paraglaciecola mesophila]|uniref:Sulfotransferase n=1 Tax=Paraglaciecola mesophila TaxID=197222 RepID=A0ABU9SWC6_9ALTE
MTDKKFIFLAGHHRSGTSLLHEIIREHDSVSGFSNTGVPEDEGMFLQNVYQPARAYGGPGKYIFDKQSYMNESHPLATPVSAEAILTQWEAYLDNSCTHYIEKSPPNIVRTRFFQKLYPDSKFVVIFRHPLAVGYATQKWSKTTIKSLIEHTLLGYEILLNDLPHLKNVYVLRYEDFVQNPQNKINSIFDFLGLASLTVKHKIRLEVNEQYYARWQRNRANIIKRLHFPLTDKVEQRFNNIGYSLRDYRQLEPKNFFGAHVNES